MAVAVYVWMYRDVCTNKYNLPQQMNATTALHFYQQAWMSYATSQHSTAPQYVNKSDFLLKTLALQCWHPTVVGINFTY